MEVLSSDEIDALLSGINKNDHPEQTGSADKTKAKIKLYDWKRPDIFSKEQIRIIGKLHEIFSRLTATALSVAAQADLKIYVASIDQLTYEEFIRSIPNPTTIATVTMDPLKGPALLEIDPAISFALVELLFGAQNPECPSRNREHTDIEQSLLEGMIIRILANLREAWSPFLDLRPRLSQIETNPNLVQIVPYTEMTILVTMEVKIGADIGGMMNLCVPWLTLEPILHKLKDSYWFGCSPATTENLTTINDSLSPRPIKVWGDYAPSGGTVALDAANSGTVLPDALPIETGYIVTGGKND